MGIPTNAVDAVSQIKDGTLGIIDVVMIGELTVSALRGLQAPSELEVTMRPVQAGFDVAEMAIKKNRVITLDIVLANPDFSVEAGVEALMTGSVDNFTETWRDKKASLEAMQDNLDIVQITTHEGVYDDMIISRIEPFFDVDENWEAWIGAVTCTQISTGQQESSDDIAGAATSALQSVGAM
jgi:hypothetical protein